MQTTVLGPTAPIAPLQRPTFAGSGACGSCELVPRPEESVTLTPGSPAEPKPQVEAKPEPKVITFPEGQVTQAQPLTPKHFTPSESDYANVAFTNPWTRDTLTQRGHTLDSTREALEELGPQLARGLTPEQVADPAVRSRAEAAQLAKNTVTALMNPGLAQFAQELHSGPIKVDGEETTLSSINRMAAMMLPNGPQEGSDLKALWQNGILGNQSRSLGQLEQELGARSGHSLKAAGFSALSGLAAGGAGLASDNPWVMGLGIATTVVSSLAGVASYLFSQRQSQAQTAARGLVEAARQGDQAVATWLREHS